MVTPVIHATWVAAGAFLVLLGALVFATRPGAALNRVLGAFLVLRGASDILFELMRDAATPEQALLFHRVANWYDWPTLFLAALFLHLLVAPRHPRLRAAAVAGVGVFTLLVLAAFALAPALFEPRLVGVPGAFFVQLGGALPQAFAAAAAVVQWVAVLLAVRDAASPTLSALQRRQAAMVGIAFGLLIGHAGVTGLALWLGVAVRGEAFGGLVPGDLAVLPGALAAAVGFFVVLAALPRLAGAFEGRARGLAIAALAGALLLGGYDAARAFLAAAGQPLAAPGLSVRFLVVAASAACLALALVRYGLAGFAAPAQRRVTTAAHAAFVLAAVALPAGLALALLGATTTGLVLALVLALVALTFSPRPLRAAAEAASRLVLVSPGDAAAVGERARVYTVALQAAAAAGGPGPADDPVLRELRRELGLSEREHDLLVHTVRARPAGPPPLLGRYRVERELGRGAFATALLATDLATGDHVVLKRFHKGWADQRALAEAKALAAVRHPRVVPLLAAERVGPEVFLVLGYAEGGTAQDLLDREGPLPPARALALTLDVLDGLSAVHAAGLAHGDVKPGNILLDRDGRALLADLGSAAALAEPDAERTLTSSPVLGSYATVAPEVLRGGRRSPRADLYATAAVLYRMLTGQDYVALEGKDAVSAVEAILHAPPRLPHPRVPGGLAAPLARALAKNPEERPADAPAMTRELVAGLDATGPPARRKRTAAGGPAGA